MKITLNGQGATDPPLQVLRRPELVLSDLEAKALEARYLQIEQAEEKSSQDLAARKGNPQANEHYQVFNLEIGHPLHLSHWGGPDTMDSM